MPRMTGGEAIVDSLVRHGIDTVFGLPGVQTYGLFDAFARASNSLRLINARHEQTTAYMALGYACATGRPAAYAVVPGPGVLNTTAALATAWGVNAPVLCLTGQVPSMMIGRGRGQLHELPDQLATLRSLLKWAERIEHPSQASYLTARAFQEMLSGRPGPVALEMPWDQFAAHRPRSRRRIRCRASEAAARSRAHRRIGEAAERGEGADAVGRWRRAACGGRDPRAGRTHRRACGIVPQRTRHRR